MVSVKQFVDESTPLGKIEINQKEYMVYSPDDLDEAHYIKYFYARAKSLDIIRKYSEQVEKPDGSISFIASRNPADNLRIEAEMITPAREMICALLQLNSTELQLKPKTITAVYSELENMLLEANMPAPADSSLPNEQEEEVLKPIDPLEKTKKE